MPNVGTAVGGADVGEDVIVGMVFGSGAAVFTCVGFEVGVGRGSEVAAGSGIGVSVGETDRLQAVDSKLNASPKLSRAIVREWVTAKQSLRNMACPHLIGGNLIWGLKVNHGGA